MNRAYFAYLIAQYKPCDGREYRPIMEVLLSYLDNSTVYCRENVLNALCALGNLQSVVNMLQILNDRQWFHHQKLLADGLMTFTGDREALAQRLWEHAKRWDLHLRIAVIQFIAGCTAQFQETFLPILKAQSDDLEVRLAILRYYRRYPYEPVRPLLLNYLQHSDGSDVSLAIVSAAVLDQYPGEDTVKTLKKALQHSNWYVRYNAATSLVNLKVGDEVLQDVLNGTDRYAKEILAYKLEEGKAGVGA